MRKRNINLFAKKESDILFSRKDRTTQIRLKRLSTSKFLRTRFRKVSGHASRAASKDRLIRPVRSKSVVASALVEAWRGGNGVQASWLVRSVIQGRRSFSAFELT